MRDAPDSAVLGPDRLIADHPLDEQARLRCGGDGPVTRLLCGGFALGNEIPVSVIGELPSVMRFDPASVAATAWLEPVFAPLALEAVRPGPGDVPWPVPRN